MTTNLPWSCIFVFFLLFFQDIDEVTITYPTMYELMYDLKGKLYLVFHVWVFVVVVCVVVVVVGWGGGGGIGEEKERRVKGYYVQFVFFWWF